MSEKLAARQSVFSFSLLLTAVYFISYLTRINHGAVISEIVAAEGIRKSIASLALTGSAITYGAGQLFSGYLGERIEPKRMVCCGLCITTAMNLAVPLCRTAAPMVVLWSINGFAQSLLWPPLVRLMSSLLSAEDYQRTCVQVSGGSAAGTAAVYLAAPLLIQLSGWRSVFTACAAAAVVMLLVWLRRCPRLAAESGRPETADNGARGPFRFSGLLLVILFCILLEGMLREGITAWMPSFISESFHLSSISILTGVILPLFSILIYNVTGVIYEKAISNVLRLSALIFLAGGGAALLLARFMTASAPLSILLSAVIVGSMHGISLLMTCMVPPVFACHGKVSFISGLLNASTYAGSALSSCGIAFFAERFGWSSTVYLWSFIALAGALLCFSITRKWAAFTAGSTDA